jgi:short-subunit dehydrogenase
MTGHIQSGADTMNQTPITTTTTKGLAVITGASSGIGAVYADRLAGRGYDLLLIARNQARLAQLATRITAQTGRTVEILGADLSNTADLARVERVLRDDPRVTLLVNNAGVGAAAPLLNAEVDAMSRMIALNVDALMRLTYAIVPAFVARRAGTIINIASIVAVAPEILNGVYGGSKAFVLAFSQSLRHELANTGVRVQVVLPGATATEFWNAMGKQIEELPQEIVMSVDDLVDAALAGFDQGEFVTVPALPQAEQWDAFEGARQALMPNLSRSSAATRYAR